MCSIPPLGARGSEPMATARESASRCRPRVRRSRCLSRSATDRRSQQGLPPASVSLARLTSPYGPATDAPPMTANAVLLFVAVFLASTVEMVEAATIVVAVGVTRGWRSALIGVGAGLLALAVVVAALGPALTAIPLNALRLAVGGLLLVFGLGWLRKAILRAAGLKALHNETETFREQRELAREARVVAGGLDTYGFTVSFKGVLLEGLEVVFIVITFGSNQGGILLASLGAVAAAVLVLGAVLVLRAPLSRVPENTLKFVVGSLLTSFGTFWGAEGAGVSWPGSDVALAVIIPTTLLISALMVAVLRRTTPVRATTRVGVA